MLDFFVNLPCVECTETEFKLRTGDLHVIIYQGFPAYLFRAGIDVSSLPLDMTQAEIRPLRLEGEKKNGALTWMAERLCRSSSKWSPKDEIYLLIANCEIAGFFLSMLFAEEAYYRMWADLKATHTLWAIELGYPKAQGVSAAEYFNRATEYLFTSLLPEISEGLRAIPRTKAAAIALHEDASAALIFRTHSNRRRPQVEITFVDTAPSSDALVNDLLGVTNYIDTQTRQLLLEQLHIRFFLSPAMVSSSFPAAGIFEIRTAADDYIVRIWTSTPEDRESLATKFAFLVDHWRKQNDA